MDSILDKIYFFKQNLRILMAQMMLNKASMEIEGSAIYTTYCNWLCSSSMHEQRDAPSEVVIYFNLSNRPTRKLTRMISSRFVRTSLTKDPSLQMQKNVKVHKLTPVKEKRYLKMH